MQDLRIAVHPTGRERMPLGANDEVVALLVRRAQVEQSCCAVGFTRRSRNTYAESGLLATLASPRRVEEAAESGGMGVEIAARIMLHPSQP